MSIYKELLNTKWKTDTCNSGSECWCRIITSVTPVFYEDGNEMYIASSGSIPTDLAEHIVKIHNESLDKK